MGTLCFTWETWGIFCFAWKKIESCTNQQQLLPETPAQIQRAAQERGTGRAGAGLGRAGTVAAQTDLQHGVEALLVQVAHDVGTDVVHGRSQGLTLGLKHSCHSHSTTAPLWPPHRKVCHCPSPPGTKSLSFYTNPSFWQHFTLYCLGVRVSSCLPLLHLFPTKPQSKEHTPLSPEHFLCGGFWNIIKVL